MNLLQRLKSWFPVGGSTHWSPSWLASAGYDPRLGVGRDNDPLPAPNESFGNAAVYRSVTLLSDALAASDMRVVRQFPGGGSERVLGTDLGRALSDWPYAEREMFLVDGLLGGNGFALIRRNTRGGIAALDTVAAWRVSLEVDTDTGAMRWHVAEDATIGAREMKVSMRDMLHLLFRSHGRHRYLGVSPLVACAPSMGIVMHRRQAGKDLFSNVSAPSFVLKHPRRLGPDTRRRLQDAWRENYGPGRGKRGGTAILEEDMDVTQVNLNKALDMQLAELSSVDTKEVARVYGVPEHLLSETGSINYSTATEAARAFVSFGLAPWAARVSTTLSQALLPVDARGTGQVVKIDLSALTRGAGEELANYLSKLVNGGIATANEARNHLGLPDMAGGDVLRAPANTLPLPTWLEHTPGAAQTAPGPSEDRALSLPVLPPLASTVEAEAAQVAESVMDLIAPRPLRLDPEFKELLR